MVSGQDFSSLIFSKRINSFAAGYRQNMALLANDPEEASSLLDEYFAGKKNPYLIYIHLCLTHLDKKEFLKAVSFCLLSEYSSKATGIDQLVVICSETLPKTTGLIKTYLQQNFNFSEIVNLINTFIKESNRDCVLVLEEFLQANNLFKDFYQELANFAISERRCMLVVTSSRPKAAGKTLGNELNLLFGNFEKIHLNQKSFFHNFLFLKNQLEPLKSSPGLIAFFVNIAGGSKTYYQVFHRSIKKFVSESDEQTIINVLEETLYRKETYFFQKFSAKINSLYYCFKDPQSMIKLLFFLSKGYMRKTSLKEIIGVSNYEITQRLNKLISIGYLNKHGNIYKIKDSLFSFWLAHTFKFYSLFPVFDALKRKKLWRQEIQEEISFFQEEFLKNRLKKVLELFLAFENDFLSLGKDKFALPKLNKAKIVSYPENDFHLLIGEGEKIIFAGIKEKTADAKDIFDFIEKGTNIKGKNIQKIFISLDELTDTAKLLAKNKKITVWNRDSLNCLLNIYNKPICLKSENTSNL